MLKLEQTESLSLNISSSCISTRIKRLARVVTIYNLCPYLPSQFACWSSPNTLKQMFYFERQKRNPINLHHPITDVQPLSCLTFREL